jgi:nucleoside-diphosphate-sugar epimerase
MASALIGYTGFVGSNLLRQGSFDACFNSKNIDEIEGMQFDRVVCAGVPAAKWIANREPVEDRQNIERLCRHLSAARADSFVLISTVDVYPVPVDVDENSTIDIETCQPYGKHRLELEQFISDRFDTTIIRLPGLFGRGLKKNVIYDFMHDNNTDQINTRSVFQFYSLEHLTSDIETALENNIRVLNITSEPTSVAEVARVCLGRDFTNAVEAEPARYDYRSCHAQLFGGNNGYLYSKQQVLADLEKYVDEVKQAGTA